MYADRLDSVRQLLREEELDAFLFWDATDIRWCCGFSGSSGLLLVDKTGALLLTDGRYRDQAMREVAVAAVEIYRDGILPHLASTGKLANGLHLGLDGDATTIAFASRLEEEFPDLLLSSLPSPLKKLKASKTDEEIDAIRRSHRITDAVFEHVLQVVRPGMREVELAAEIVFQHLTRGAERIAFDPIVASGPNGALPHARPTGRQIQKGDLVVLDFGCFVDGYASDMSRTIAIGEPEADARRAYQTVLAAHSEAQQRARSGMAASELDGIARRLISDAGFGDAFAHSLGHGLGLNVHEWPRIAASSKDTLPERAVVTIEPGVYIDGRFGIRIENAVFLTSSGAEPFPASDTSLIVI